MDEAEVALIAKHITLSWPSQVLEPTSSGLWIKDFALMDCATMVAAVDELRRTQDFMPTTHQLLAAHGTLYSQMRAQLPPARAVPEVDPARPYSAAWRLLTETWLALKSASYRMTTDRNRVTVATRALFARVNAEIQALHITQLRLMPDGPDAIAPPALVAEATAVKERVRALLFAGDAPAPKAPAPVPAMPFDDDRTEDPDDVPDLDKYEYGGEHG